MPRRLHILAPALLLVGSLSAARDARAAQDVWVESDPLGSRDQASDLAGAPAIVPSDHLQARVLRRFVKGRGWCWVVRVDGVRDVAEGQRIAAGLASAGTHAVVLEREGDRVQTLGETAASSALPVDGADSTPDADGGLHDARAVLRLAVKAHGGEKGGMVVLEQALAVELDVERSVAIDKGHILAANRYYRQGNALRLEVQIVEGSGTDSVTVLTADNHAWVKTGDDVVARDAARTREVLGRFSPEAVLAVPLGLAHDISSAADWQDLVSMGRVTRDGAEQVQLGPDAPSDDEGLVSAWFDAASGTLSEVQWRTAAGLIDFAYKDYRTVAENLVVPFEVTINRDGAEVEQIRVLRLAVSPTLDPALFDAPHSP